MDPIQEWISVNQAMPFPEVDVLVANKGHIMIACSFVDIFCEEVTFIHPEVNLNQVTHWMSLPDLPL